LVPFFGVPSQTREFLGRLQITSDEQFLALVLFFSFSYVGIPALSPFIDTFLLFSKEKKKINFFSFAHLCRSVVLKATGERQK
jgi:NADH:ubiquinone oxidoreductase subunit 4 (subunit M)